MILLQPHQRTKLDTSNDTEFYSSPRFVTHVDDRFIARLTQLYRDRLNSKMRILDLMSSWVSHLPEEMTFAHVEGHGMNEAELAQNPRLNHYFVQDLNQTPQLPLEDVSFDAVLIAVSIQYLQYPEAIMSEIGRILIPGGLVIISFSNRMFFQKAIAAWREGADQDRLTLVMNYIKGTAGWGEPEAIAEVSTVSSLLAALGLGITDPFYAVIAQKL